MKRAIILLLIISTGAVYGQKCKYKVNQEDPMTGVKKLMTEFIIDNCRFNMLRSGDKFEFKATYYLDNERNVIIPKGRELSLRLSDGTLIKLLSSKDAPPVSKAVGGSVSTHYIVMYNVDKATMEKIKEQGIVAVSTQLDSEWVRKVKEKQTEKSKNAARCLLL